MLACEARRRKSLQRVDHEQDVHELNNSHCFKKEPLVSQLSLFSFSISLLLLSTPRASHLHAPLP